MRHRGCPTRYPSSYFFHFFSHLQPVVPRYNACMDLKTVHAFGPPTHMLLAVRTRCCLRLTHQAARGPLRSANRPAPCAAAPKRRASFRTFASASIPEQLMSKRKMVKIGTHSGTFHCDEALGCFMLLQTSKFKDAEIVRSRDPEVLKVGRRTGPRLALGKGCNVETSADAAASHRGGNVPQSRPRSTCLQRAWSPCWQHGLATMSCELECSMQPLHLPPGLRTSAPPDTHARSPPNPTTWTQPTSTDRTWM